jgi:hypothetical protein
MVKKRRIFSLFMTSVILVALATAFTSCGFGPMFYDMVFGGKGDEVRTYTLEVSVRYTGFYTIDSATPLFIAAFGLYFDGDEPDIVYLGGPILSDVGSYSFTGLEELAYGVLVFIDFDSNEYPTDGDIYQFYNWKSQMDGPDEIYLDQNESLSMLFDDSFVWSDSGGAVKD